MKTLAFAAVAALGVAVFTPVVHADDLDNKTTIKVNETISVPGRTLTPGTYVIKLLPSFTNRNIVQIFNEDQSQLQATILAINNYRLEPKDKTTLQYWETPSGSPPALRAWFAPGENYGQEFAYPKKMADQLAHANNDAKVPSYADNTEISATSPDKIAVENADSQADAAPAPVLAAVPQRVERAEAPVTPPTVVAQQPEPARPTETLLAQNERPAQQPQLVPESSDAATQQLPQTATSLGSILAIGLVLLSSAAIFRYSRKA